MTSPKLHRDRLELAQRHLMEAVVTAIPALNIDFTATVADNGKGGFEVRLIPITKKGEAYMPYLAEHVKKELIGETDEKNELERAQERPTDTSRQNNT